MAAVQNLNTAILRYQSTAVPWVEANEAWLSKALTKLTFQQTFVLLFNSGVLLISFQAKTTLV